MSGPEGSTPAAPVHRMAAATPGIARRLASFLYEGVLLFGVVMAAGLLYSPLTGQRHALQGTVGLQLFLFLVIGVYFVTFWSRSGQTVAMKTWRIRLVARDGGPVSQPRALARYLLSWLWFAPALATIKLAHFTSAGPIATLLVFGIAAYAALAWLRPDRQYWHDAVCGTRLIDWSPPPKRAA